MSQLPGEKLLIKLWETITEKGIGGFLSPWTIRRDGAARTDVRCQEIRALAQAEKDAEDIRAGRARISREGKLVLIPSSRPNSTSDGDLYLDRVEPYLELRSAVESATVLAGLDAFRHEVNVTKAVCFAEERLVDDPHEPPADTVSDDWLFAWRDHAGRTSSEELQRLWGSVLAGEVKSPGSYSLRTMDFMRGLSKEEALVLTSLAKFAINDFVARSQMKYLDKQGLNFGTLLRLQEIGVLAGVEGLGLTTTLSTMEKGRYLHVLVSHNKALVVEHSDSTKTLTIAAYPLTTVGQQVLRLGTFETDVTYLEAVGRDIVKEGFTVYLGDWKRLDNGRGEFKNGVPLGV